MTTRLLCLFCLFGNVFSKTPPDVDCQVVHLKHVFCDWAKNGLPDANYTFYSRFENEKQERECTSYLTKNNVTTGCKQPCKDLDRFYTFHVRLEHANHSFTEKYNIKSKVLLNPPTNLTVMYGGDQNLWYHWNQTHRTCVESEVRYRLNNGKWKIYTVSTGRQSYSINLPSQSRQYELQVRSKLGSSCGESQFWSNWSEPVIWGSNNSTGTKGNSYHVKDSMEVWTPVLYVVGAIAFILLLMMFLQHERLRVILIPVVPKPSLIPNEIEDWFKISKDLKDRFNTNYNERAYPVCEYFPVSHSNSVTSSVTTNQTNCLASLSEDKPQDPPSSRSSSVSTAAQTENE